jgi:hypothetical protein
MNSSEPKLINELKELDDIIKKHLKKIDELKDMIKQHFNSSELLGGGTNAMKGFTELFTWLKPEKKQGTNKEENKNDNLTDNINKLEILIKKHFNSLLTLQYNIIKIKIENDNLLLKQDIAKLISDTNMYIKEANDSGISQINYYLYTNQSSGISILLSINLLQNIGKIISTHSKNHQNNIRSINNFDTTIDKYKSYKLIDQTNYIILLNNNNNYYNSEINIASNTFSNIAINLNSKINEINIYYIKGILKVLQDIIKNYKYDVIKHVKKQLIIEQSSDVINNIVKNAIKTNGLLLFYLDSNFKKDKEIVEIAVTQNGLALKYVDETLEGYDIIVEIAVNQNYLALEHTSEKFKTKSEYNNIVIRLLRKYQITKNDYDVTKLKDVIYIINLIQQRNAWITN